MKQYRFQFKQFAVSHRHSGMKVGTDSILLGAWCPLNGDERRVLDIGSGCGVLSLMLAQRLPQAQITGVDIDESAWSESQENARQSPWSERLKMEHADIRSFQSGDLYDVIVSNPPYFDHLVPLEIVRMKARHQASMTHDDLLHAVNRMLTRYGTFSIILPFDQHVRFLSIARACGLYPQRMTTVRHRQTTPPKRVLMQLIRDPVGYTASELIIGDGNGFTPEYLRLTEAFHQFPETKKATNR
jgi:tRNA1Val (adenine37-N6)-methyltransferase